MQVANKRVTKFTTKIFSRPLKSTHLRDTVFLQYPADEYFLRDD